MLARGAGGIRPRPRGGGGSGGRGSPCPRRARTTGSPPCSGPRPPPRSPLTHHGRWHGAPARHSDTGAGRIPLGYGRQPARFSDLGHRFAAILLPSRGAGSPRSYGLRGFRSAGGLSLALLRSRPVALSPPSASPAPSSPLSVPFRILCSGADAGAHPAHQPLTNHSMV